jgi:protein involved in polysaccharide export with SLBB domain
MRVTRSLTLLLVLALAVAGCAGQPVAQLGSASPPAPAAMSTGGIDSLVYGSPRPLYASTQTPAPAAAPVGRGLFAAAEPPPVAPAPALDSRGLFASAAPPPVAPAPAADGRGLFAESLGPAAVPPPATRVAAPRAAAPVNAAYAPDPNRPYTLDSGDRLRVVVFGQDGLSNSYLVDASGHIAMPLIGSVSARGLTTDGLSSRIAERLRQGFVREPHVAVEVEAYRPFFILGEVTQPGQYPYVADMTAETAVAIAGGFGPRAYRQTVVLTRTVNGRQTRMTVPTSYPLRPGDTVNVQERWF